MSTVRSDFFLDPSMRLSEQERALMRLILGDLVEDIADELRSALPPGWSSANDDDPRGLVARLTSARLVDSPELMAILLRRADEQRIATALRSRSVGRPAFLQALIAQADDEVSAAAMALILARGRRQDRLGQPRIDFDDLSPSFAARLAASVAAAVGAGLPATVDRIEGDRLLSDAALDLVRRHDAARSLDALTQALAQALHDRGMLDDALLGAAAQDGDVAFLAEALARRAQIPGPAAWDHLLDGRNSGLACLARMAGADRTLVATLLAALADLVGINDPAAEIECFESIDDDKVERTRAWLRLDPSYRAAAEALGTGRGGDGQRTV